MLERQIKDFEKRYARQPTVRMAVGFAMRQWLAYAVADVPEPKEYLYRANHVVLSAQRKNESDLRLFWLGIYFAIVLGHFDKANEALDDAYAYRSYYKNNQPFQYKVLHFLYAYLEIKQKRTKTAKKHMHTLENSRGRGPLHLLMIGMLHLALYDYEAAYKCLLASYKEGCRSAFLFNALFSYYRAKANRAGVNRTGTERIGKKSERPEGTAFLAEECTELLLQTVHWALNHGADVENIIAVYQGELLQRGQIILGERIYQQFPNPWILKELCSHYMAIPDYSPKAYGYYRDAERRQVFLPNLSYFLVRAAFENRAEKIHHYTMVQYLRKIPSDEDIHLQVYVYHLLLTDPGLSDLAAAHANDILLKAVHCLQIDIRSRYANSLYYFYWIKCNEMYNIPGGSQDDPNGRCFLQENVLITDELADKAEEILLEDLCKFQVIDHNNTVRHLYINERERQGITDYKFPSDGTTLIVEAIGSGFFYTCLSEGRRNVLDQKLEIRRMVSNAGAALYRHFYNKGQKKFEITAYLAKLYMRSQSAEKISGRYERAIEEGYEPVLEDILEDKQSSKIFKTQCSVFLGQLYYRKGWFKKALEYYSMADEDDLDDHFLEHMLTAYVSRGAYEAAAGLVERKGHGINDKILFDALKPLAAPEQKEWHPAISGAAYHLLLKSRFDKNLLEVVLTHFNGTQEQWLSLSYALSAIAVQAPRLDEIILNNAVWAHHFDEGTQRVFVRRVAGGMDKTLEDFIYYAVHEMIIGRVKPLLETLTALERICICSCNCTERIGKKSERPEGAAFLEEECTERIGKKSERPEGAAFLEEECTEHDNLVFGLAHVYLGYGISTVQSDAIIRSALASQEYNGILFPIFKGSKRITSTYIEKYRPFMHKALPGKDVRLYYRFSEEEEWRVQCMGYWRFGLYLTCVPHFYNETMYYYFSEELPTGSITTLEEEIHNNDMYLDENQSDPFFVINNATIYEQMFRYEQVEEIISGLVKDVRAVQSKLM